MCELTHRLNVSPPTVLYLAAATFTLMRTSFCIDHSEKVSTCAVEGGNCAGVVRESKFVVKLLLCKLASSESGKTTHTKRNPESFLYCLS